MRYVDVSAWKTKASEMFSFSVINSVVSSSNINVFLLFHRIDAPVFSSSGVCGVIYETI